jgi:hypothetical protein
MARAVMRKSTEQLRRLITGELARRARDENLTCCRTIRIARDATDDRSADAAERRRSGRLAPHQPPCDLGDDRAASTAWRGAHSSPCPGPQRGPARLAAPEARAIAGGVTGDERHTTTIPRRRLGGGHYLAASRRVATSGAETRIPLLEVGGPTMGAGS